MTRPTLPTPAAALRAATLALLPLVVGGCASSGLIEPELPRGVTADEAVASVEADLRAGAADEALVRIAAVQNERGVSPELRNESDALADRAVEIVARDARAAEGTWDAEQLERLARLDLPLRQRARLAVAAGEAHLREGSRIQAFKHLRDFEEANPGHPEGAAASEVIATAGFSLIEDPGRYALFRRYRSRGVGALELLVLRYPSHPRCPAAYEALANTYIDRGDLDRAIERLEDLLLYHPRDPRAPGAEARLPRLRMARIDRDDFDRSELERARDELEAWLDRYDRTDSPGLALVDEVRTDLATCTLRLANNDLIVARFNRKIDVDFGVRQHASRALALAERAAAEAVAVDGGDGLVRAAEAAAEDARSLLATVSDAEPARAGGIADEAPEAPAALSDEEERR